MFPKFTDTVLDQNTLLSTFPNIGAVRQQYLVPSNVVSGFLLSR